MSKFKNEIKDLYKVLDDRTDSIENLVEHKRIIKILIGNANENEDLRVKAQNEYQELREKINILVYKADKILDDKDILDKLKSIKSDEISEFYTRMKNVVSDLSSNP